jgi:hypothetical protein
VDRFTEVTRNAPSELSAIMAFGEPLIPLRLIRVLDGNSLIFRLREDPSTRPDGCCRKRGIGSACVR